MTKAALLCAAAAAAAGCSQIDSDQAGFKTSFGKPDETVLGPGLYGISPIGGSMVKYTVREMRLDARLQAYTKDMQQADLSVAAVYAPDRSRLVELHVKYGPGYASVLVEPAVAAAVKDVVGQWEAERLVNNRDKATASIRDKASELLAGSPVSLRGLSIMNIDYSDAFEKAIEEKVVQQQSALKARNKTTQVEEEAKQQLIIAQSIADSMAIYGKAIKENRDLIFYEAIKKWDGKAPQYLAIGLNGVNPVIDITGK